MLTVHNYGAHFTEGGIGLLVQDDGIQHALEMNFDIPVRVQKSRRTLHCPHNIRLEGVSDIPLPDDDLLKVFLPLPKEQELEPICLPDDDLSRLFVKQAMRLSSPTNGSGMQPLWLLKPQVLIDQLHITNLQPLVLYGYAAPHHPRLNRLIEASRFAPRRLVILLPEMMWMTQTARSRISTSPTDLEGLPLERIGAHHLRLYLKSQGG